MTQDIKCSKCGRLNAAGSAFCQDCGTRLGGPAPDSDRPSAVAGVLGDDAACPRCGATNAAHVVFCVNCGARVGAPRPASSAAVSAPPHASAPPRSSAPPVARSSSPPLTSPVAPMRSGPAPQGVSCDNCGQFTPAGFAFCQHCGRQLGGSAGPPPAHTPPAGIRVSTQTPAPALGIAALHPPVGAPAPSFGHPVGRSPALSTPPPSTTSVPAHRGVSVAPAYAAAPRPQMAPAHGVRLVGVNRDGTDGHSYGLQAERFEIGRTAGHLVFEQDRYLSERHVRIERRAGRYYVVDLDSLNGVFIRLRHAEPLDEGALLLIGMQLLRFESVLDPERDPGPAMEHGALLFGTPPRRPWGRLRQITTAGITRDVYHLYRSEVILGRESGDIVFSDDEFMSRAHTALRHEGGRAQVVDLNSSNGTFLRVRRERVLAPGDLLRLGDQLLRFESP